MSEAKSPRPPVTPQVEYRFRTVQQDPASGDWVDPATGMNYQAVITSSAAEGWKFVQAVSVGLHGRTLDLVLERPLHFRPLVIGHVPKTAGTSITNIIRSYMRHVVGVSDACILQYGYLIPYTDMRPLRQLPLFVRLVAGHFGSDHYQLLLRTNPFIVASMRDPFSRLLSTLEHEYRDAVACPENADAAIRQRYGRILSVIERIAAGRQDAPAIRASLEDLRSDYVPAADYLLYAGKPIAHAWIESGDVGRLCTALAATAADSKAVIDRLEPMSHANIYPARLFQDFDAADRSRFRDCFHDVFREETALFDRVTRETPRLFTDEAWTMFLECLWRRKAENGWK